MPPHIPPAPLADPNSSRDRDLQSRLDPATASTLCAGGSLESMMLVRLPALWQSGRKRYAIFRYFCARQVIFPAASCRMTVAGETCRACPADFAREGFSKEYLALIFGTCPAASSLPGTGPGAGFCDGTAAAFRLNPEAEGQIDWRREEIEVKLGIEIRRPDLHNSPYLHESP